MSRLRRAAVAASFGYLQYLVAIVSGIVMVPVTLHYLGARRYGLWLASGELLGYAAMVDLGVIGVLPWMLAEADGREDRESMRALVANGLALGAIVGLGYAILAAGLWLVLPSALSLSADDRLAIGGPLAVLAAAVAIAYPLRVFNAVLTGLQDVTFNGLLAVAQAILSVAITAVMLFRGYGLFAIATAAAVTSTGVVVAALVRTAILAPDLLRHLPRPTWPMVGSLLGNGLGVWCSTFGWQILAASNGLVMTTLGRLEWVAVYACTAKLSSIATQLTWVMPDAGLVGLAQVHGEGRGTDRVRTLVLMMLRLHLLLAGGAACGLLAFNPAFVTGWVGPDFFGGLALNSLLAAGIVVSSFIHGLLSAASVVGPRRQVGLVAILNGVAQIGCAVMFGRAFGLPGIAGAAVIAGLVTSVPGGVRLLRSATALTGATIWRNLVGPWLWRFTPLVAIAASCGFLSRDRGVAVGLALGTCCGLAYVWHMRPLYAELPFDPRWSRWLVSLRLVPAPEAERA
jgi:O-antigen/teichoic acid export membrane protein